MWILKACFLLFYAGVIRAEVNQETCIESLGVRMGGYLPDSAFTASSYLAQFGPEKGRLGNNKTAWIPDGYMNNNKNQHWLQVDLGLKKNISAVITQGYSEEVFVHTFRLLFSMDGKVYDTFYHGQAPKNFRIEKNDIAVNKLNCPIIARYVRFVPIKFVRGTGIGMKVDVLGCAPGPKKSPTISNFRPNLVTTNKVNLTWEQTQPVGVFSFTYHVYDAISLETSQFSQFNLDPKKNMSLPITYSKYVSALSSCTKYQFILRSFNKEGCGIPEVLTYVLVTKESRPLTPQDFSTDNNVPETLLLTWKKSRPGYLCSGEIKKFQITYNFVDSALPDSIVEVDSEVTSYNLTGLKQKRYNVKIVSINYKGNISDPIKMINIQVKGKPPSNRPNITKLYSDQPGTIKVFWNETQISSSGTIRSYSLFYKLVEDEKYTQRVLEEKESREYTITNLLYWRRYSVYVSLVTLSLQSEQKEVLVLGDRPGRAPKNLTLRPTYTSIQISWDPIPEEYRGIGFKGYQVFTVEGVVRVKEKLFSVTITNNTVYDYLYLKPGSNYSVAVAGLRNTIAGPLSEIKTVTTYSGDLPKPLIESALSNAPQTIFVSWKMDSKVIPANFILFYKESKKLGDWTQVKLSGAVFNYTISSLTAWKSYDIVVNVTSKGLRTSTSNVLPIVVVGETPGRAPKNFQAVQVGYVWVELKWDPVDVLFVYGNLTGYKIKYGRKGDSNAFSYNTTVENKIVVGQLIHDTEYHFYVAAMTKKGVGVYSTFVEVRTKKIKPPSKPVILKVTNISPSRIKLEWEKKGNITSDLSFTIKLRDTSGRTKERTKTFLFAEQSSHFVKIFNVEAFVHYQIKIRSCIFHVCGEFSAPKYITTLEDAPSAVFNITILNKVDAVDILWQRPKIVPGILRKYILDVRDLNGRSVGGYPIDLRNDTLNFTMSGLPFDQRLIAELKAYTVKSGPGLEEEFKSPQGFPSEPSDLDGIFLKGNDIISLRWKEPRKPNGVITGYQIILTGKKSYISNYLENRIFNLTVKEVIPYMIKNLVPGSEYRIEVKARTVRGLGDSAIFEFFTKLKEPLRPRTPSVVRNEIFSTSFVLNIFSANQTNGRIDSYQVIVEDSSNNELDVVLPVWLAGYEEGSRIYITAEIGKILPRKFRVGDNKEYNGYKNVPLKENTKYKIHVRAKSIGRQTYYGQPSTVEVTTAVARPPEKPTDGGVNFLIPTLVGILVVFIIIGIIVGVIYYVRYRSNRQKKDTMNQFELGLMRVEDYEEDKFDGEPLKKNSFGSDYPVRSDHPPIPIASFAKTVAKLHEKDNTGFRTEYNKMEISREFSWDIANLPENFQKNRYENIIAYDHSRVVLSSQDGEADYINASFIPGYNQENKYIATQGPLRNTFNDFWKMVWEVNSSTIVMLTNLQEKNKVKCHKYWPDDCTEYGDFLVTPMEKEIFSDFTIRVFTIEKLPQTKENPDIREIHQFHFTCWPEHGVPKHATQMVNFQKLVKDYAHTTVGPTIVHCSAGVGRTGAYIVMDTMLDRANAQGDLDIFNYISWIRKKRIAMVQTQDQYIFLHDAILEAVMTGKTSIKMSRLKEAFKNLDQLENGSKINGFEKQWKTLNHSHSTAVENYDCASSKENKAKNRFSTVLPIDKNRVLLQIIDDDETTSYINATYVDSYRRKNHFILTQSPLPDTKTDFWRMVFEHGSNSIVMLNGLKEGPDYAQFWPDQGFRDFGPITVHSLAEDDDFSVSLNNSLRPMYRTPTNEIVVRNFKVTDTRSPSKSLRIKFFQYIGWIETRVPNSHRPTISLINQLERWRNQTGNEGPITILCSDGIGRTGTFAAILFTLERMRIDKKFDAFQAIKTMRVQRPHIVKQFDQFKFIHFAVQEYVAAFEQQTKL